MRVREPPGGAGHTATIAGAQAKSVGEQARERASIRGAAADQVPVFLGRMGGAGIEPATPGL